MKRTNDINEILQAGYRYGWSLAHQHQDAEDLLQQAVYRLTARYGSVKNKSILYKTMRNLFIDQERRKIIVQFDPILELEPAFPVKEPNSTSNELDDLLGHLRPEEREALFLNAVEGYTAKEISAATDTPRGTVLSHIHRAKNKLKALLKNEFNTKEATHE